MVSMGNSSSRPAPFARMPLSLRVLLGVGSTEENVIVGAVFVLLVCSTEPCDKLPAYVTPPPSSPSCSFLRGETNGAWHGCREISYQLGGTQTSGKLAVHRDWKPFVQEASLLMGSLFRYPNRDASRPCATLSPPRTDTRHAREGERHPWLT